MKKSFFPCVLILFFSVMLYDSQSTFQGALKGLNLWLFTVVPSLLPYMIISSYMTESGTFRYLSAIISPITTKIFHLSKDCGYVILLGFLCGYPIGSKLSADLVKKNQISKKEGQILLSFCNNVSPAFLLTYLIGNIIKLPAYNSTIIWIMILTPICCGIAFSWFTYLMTKHNFSIHSNHKSLPDNQTISTPCTPASIDTCILNSFENVFKLGGYIILFSILNEFILIHLSNCSNRIICSLFEITSGLSCYNSLNISVSQKIPECLSLTAFGGFCCLAQTYSMIKGSGLSIGLYFIAKSVIALAVYFVSIIFLSFY